jgi:transposase
MKNYKVLDVAKRYKVTVFTVYAWMRDGKLPHSTTMRGMRSCKIITHENLIEMENTTGIRPA